MPQRRASRLKQRRTLLIAAVAAAPLLGSALAAFAAAGRRVASGRRGVDASAGAGAGSGSSDDLLVYGAGYLGRLVAQRWLEERPASRVVGVTRSDAHHEELRALGLEPRTAGADLASAAAPGSFANVVFAAPPGAARREGEAAQAAGSYADAVGEALSYWSGPDSDHGGFVFTSSGGVFAEDAGGTVDEVSPVSESPRTAVLLEAEGRARQGRGTVLRLAGLYDVLRGAHAYWLKVGTIKGSPDGVINLLHYEDAAGAVLAGLARGSSARGETFIVGDGVPTTRSEIIEAARKSPQFEGAAAPVFDVPEGAPKRSGKVYDVRKVRDLLQWTPRYKSFAQFMSLQR